MGRPSGKKWARLPHIVGPGSKGLAALVFGLPPTAQTARNLAKSATNLPNSYRDGQTGFPDNRARRVDSGLKRQRRNTGFSASNAVHGSRSVIWADCANLVFFAGPFYNLAFWPAEVFLHRAENHRRAGRVK
jgi:hypothetical protein